jgi:hypothetical protein
VILTNFDGWPENQPFFILLTLVRRSQPG